MFDQQGTIVANNYTISVASARDVRDHIRYEHYLGSIPPNRLILVAKRGGIIIGISIFGNGTNKHIKPDTWELVRLCIPFFVVKPFSCEFINESCNYIKKHYPQIKRLVSFADSSVGHNGGVYRMAGWSKDGHTKESYAYLDAAKMELRHKSCCRRIPGIDKTEKQLATERNLIKIRLGQKYRYTISL